MGSDIEAIRADPSILAGLGLREITEHYAQFVEKLDEPPVLIGHSMGGLVVQMLLGCGLGAAGVSIDGAAPKGVYRLPLSVLKAAGPVLFNPLNVNRTVMLTFEQFRYAFANTMTRAVARELYEREVIPGPGRPIFEVAFGNWSPSAANKSIIAIKIGLRYSLLRGARTILCRLCSTESIGSSTSNQPR